MRALAKWYFRHWQILPACGFLFFPTIALAQSLPNCAVQLVSANQLRHASQITVAPGTAVTLEAHCNYPGSDLPPTFRWADGRTSFDDTVIAPATLNSTATYTVSITQAGNVKTYSGRVTTAASTSLLIPDSGFWWNPAEGGRGFSIERQGNNLFLAAFLYDNSGRATWYGAGPGVMDGSTYAGALTIYGGGQTLTGGYKPAGVAGSAGIVTVNFSSPTQASLTWPGGTIPVARYDIVPAGASVPPPFVQPETGYWWSPGEGGRGYTIEIQNNTLFLAGYMYDAQGNPLWYASGPTPLSSAATYQSTWTQYSGGQTLTGSYRAPGGAAATGNVTMQFSDTANAILTLPDGRQIPITRYRFSDAIPAPPLASSSAPDGTTRISASSTFAANCNGLQSGLLYPNAEVEPSVAINPRNAANIVAVWQQDRWSNGSSQGIVTGASFDGGGTWAIRTPHLSNCGGGNAANGGNYARSTDPWVTFSPNGTAYLMALSTTGGIFTDGSSNAMLVSRSTDGGVTWSEPTALIRDGSGFFNDKNSITADPNDSRYVYAVWDRLVSTGGGPTYFSRTTDGGLTWEAARSIFDPGPSKQTLANEIAVLPNGTLVNMFTQLADGPNNTLIAFLAVMRSSDKGATWSAPVKIADMMALGATNPGTGAKIRDGSNLARIGAGGNGDLVVTWQDSRFSGGTRDGIVLSRSTDGGITWSAPGLVNGDAAVQAFIPTVRVRADGMIGISYFDFRTPGSTTSLVTDYWLARSSDGVNWNDSHISGPFDLQFAPNAGGLFLGDYQALTSIGTSFVSVFVQANSDTGNRTDTMMKVMNDTGAGTSASAPAVQTMAGAAAGMIELTPDLRQRIHDNIVRVMERRTPGWSRIMLRKSK